jgi:hypothetical protein
MRPGTVRSISKRKAEELAAAAYPVWTPQEIDAALRTPNLDLDIGRDQSIVYYPSANHRDSAYGVQYRSREWVPPTRYSNGDPTGM